MYPLSGDDDFLMRDLFALGEVCLRCYGWLENEKASVESKMEKKHKTNTRTHIKLRKATWQSTRRSDPTEDDEHEACVPVEWSKGQVTVERSQAFPQS